MTPQLISGLSECLLLASNLENVPEPRGALHILWLDSGGRKEARGVYHEN